MNEETTPKKSIKNRLTLSIIVILLIILSFFVGWFFGRSAATTHNYNGVSNDKSQSTSTSNAAGAKLKDLVSYTLPDGWSENVCSESSVALFFIPNGAILDCNTNPIAPIKAYVDTQNTTDCQQLNTASIQNIRKHTCISLYIDGHKSLKSFTEYGVDSAYKIDTTISGYYINTGKGVTVIEYTFTSVNDYQTGFDQLANSVKVKD